MVTPTSPVLEVDDPAAADRVLALGRSIGHRYVGLDTPSSSLAPGSCQRRAPDDAHVPADGSGSHWLATHSDLAPFTDPDGFSRGALAAADDPVA